MRWMLLTLVLLAGCADESAGTTDCENSACNLACHIEAMSNGLCQSQPNPYPCFCCVCDGGYNLAGEHRNAQPCTDCGMAP